MKKIVFLLLVVFIASSNCLDLCAQKKDVTGCVVDLDGKPVKGARIGVVTLCLVPSSTGQAHAVCC